MNITMDSVEADDWAKRQRELDEAFECGAEAMRGEVLSVCCKMCVGPIDALGLPEFERRGGPLQNDDIESEKAKNRRHTK